MSWSWSNLHGYISDATRSEYQMGMITYFRNIEEILPICLYFTADSTLWAIIIRMSIHTYYGGDDPLNQRSGLSATR